MTPRSLDHFVLLVENLEAAAVTYQRLGFHVRPVAELVEVGAANCVIHFPETYLELAWLSEATHDVGAPYMDRLKLGEGFAHLCLTSERLEPDREHMQALGLAPDPIYSARRRIIRPDGSEDETASRFFYMWRGDNPYLSIFLADHPKPDAIFIPEYTDHPNTAEKVSRVVYMSKNPDGDIDYFTKLFGKAPVTHDADGFSVVDGRGDLAEVLTETRARARYGDNLAAPSCDPLRGAGIAMHFKIGSRADCSAYLRQNGILFMEEAQGLVVPAREARGCVLVFED